MDSIQTDPRILGSSEIVPPRFKSISDALSRHAETKADKIAFVEYGEGRSLTFGELHLSAMRVASALLSHGSVGSSVALTASSGVEAIVAYMGILYAGMAPVMLPTPEHCDLIESFIPIVRTMRTAVHTTLAVDATSYALSRHAKAENWYGSQTLLRLSDLVKNEGTLKAPVAVDDTSPGHWIFSSGTTGPSKAIRLSKKAIAFNLEYTASSWHYTCDSRVVGVGAPYHSAGLMVGYLMPLYVGGSAILLSPHLFSTAPGSLLGAISSSRASHLACPDSAVARCNKLQRETFKTTDLRSLQVTIIGGEPLTFETLSGFEEHLQLSGASHVQIGTAFGMSEAAGLITSTGWRHPLSGHFDIAALTKGRAEYSSNKHARYIASAGAPGHGVQVCVIDADGKALPANRIGRIVFASPSLFDAYEGFPSEHVKIEVEDGVFRADFMATGDLGFIMDGPEGRELAIVGRSKEAIQIGQTLYYGMDLEQTAASCHPALDADMIVATSDPDIPGAALLLIEAPAGSIPESLASGAKDALLAAFPDLAVRVVVVPPHSVPWIPTSSKKPRLRARTAVAAREYEILASDPPRRNVDFTMEAKHDD